MLGDLIVVSECRAVVQLQGRAVRSKELSLETNECCLSTDLEKIQVLVTKQQLAE
jgi:hypothetical protein